MALLNRTTTIFIGLMLYAMVGQAQAAPLTIEPALQEQFADQLFSNGQYRRAAEEYQRYVFFFTDHARRRAIQLKAAQAFLLAKDPQTALTVLKPLTSGQDLDAIAIEAFFVSARCHLQLNAFTLALVQLNNLIALSDEPDVEDRAYYHIAWIHIDRTDWPAAVRALDRITSDGRQRYGVDALSKPLEHVSEIPQKNPVAAGVLSIVPGGGQLYCQRYKDALIAFVLNVGTFWAASDAFDNDQAALGGLLSMVGLGFYAGNIYGAVNDAHKFNATQKRRFVDQLKQKTRGGGMSLQPTDGGMIIGMHISF